MRQPKIEHAGRILGLIFVAGPLATALRSDDRALTGVEIINSSSRPQLLQLKRHHITYFPTQNLLLQTGKNSPNFRKNGHPSAVLGSSAYDFVPQECTSYSTGLGVTRAQALYLARVDCLCRGIRTER